ncbi:MAG: FecR family protein [Thiobacillaceae bacterium]
MQKDEKPGLVDHEEIALDWFVRRRSGNFSTDDQVAFAAWYAASPGHTQAYDRAEALSQKFAALKQQPSLSASQQAFVPQRRWRASYAAFAMLWALVMGVVWWQTGLLEADYRTAQGEQRRIALPDGSALELNTASTAHVRYTRFARTIALQSGEAYFNVAHESHRTFIVSADDLAIRDIGTRFIVRRDGPATEVSVLEGQVELSDIHQAGSPLPLMAGQQRIYQAGLIGENNPVDMAATEAWRSGRLVFNAAPLGDIARELARYHPFEIRFADPGLAHETLTASFRIGDTPAFLQAAESVLDVRARPIGNTLILYRASPANSPAEK